MCIQSFWISSQINSIYALLSQIQLCCDYAIFGGALLTKILWWVALKRLNGPIKEIFHLGSVIKLYKLGRFLWIISMSKFLTSISAVALAVPDVERTLYYSCFLALMKNMMIIDEWHNSTKISLPFCSLGLLGHWWHQAWAGWDCHQRYLQKDNILSWSNKSKVEMLPNHNKRCVYSPGDPGQPWVEQSWKLPPTPSSWWLHHFSGSGNFCFDVCLCLFGTQKGSKQNSKTLFSLRTPMHWILWVS